VKGIDFTILFALFVAVSLTGFCLWQAAPPNWKG
jgi:hypothetical protein